MSYKFYLRFLVTPLIKEYKVFMKHNTRSDKETLDRGYLEHITIDIRSEEFKNYVKEIINTMTITLNRPKIIKIYIRKYKDGRVMVLAKLTTDISIFSNITDKTDWIDYIKNKMIGNITRLLPNSSGNELFLDKTGVTIETLNKVPNEYKSLIKNHGKTWRNETMKYNNTITINTPVPYTYSVEIKTTYVVDDVIITHDPKSISNINDNRTVETVIKGLINGKRKLEWNIRNLPSNTNIYRNINV